MEQDGKSRGKIIGILSLIAMIVAICANMTEISEFIRKMFDRYETESEKKSEKCEKMRVVYTKKCVKLDTETLVMPGSTVQVPISFKRMVNLVRRNAMEDLIRWKVDEERKPMVLKGARQVGKTWLMKEFGACEYERMVYINFDRNQRMKNLFEGSLEELRQNALQSGFAADHLEDMFLAMVDQDNADRKQRAKL